MRRAQRKSARLLALRFPVSRGFPAARARILIGAIFAALCLLVAACSGTAIGTENSGGDAGTPGPTSAPPAIEAAPAQPAGVPSGMASAEAALGARESWLARGISTYSYTAQVHLTTGPDDTSEPTCGSTGGQVSVRIAAGVPIEARVVDIPCVIDTTAPGRIPLTFSEWFTRVSNIGIDSLAVQFDLGPFGEPASMYTEGKKGSLQFDLIDFVPGSAEPDSVVPTTVGGDLESAQALWDNAGVADYELTVERVCRCTSEFRGPFDVTVTSGAVVLVTVDGSPSTADIDPDSLSVNGLLATVADFGDADRLDVVFDHTRGIPVIILADPVLGTADDEVELRVTRFEVLPRSNDPITSALVDLGAALDTAPTGTTDLNGARFCGVDKGDWNDEFIGGDPIARACFVDGVTRSIASVLVQAGPGVDSGPFVDVLRVGADGTITDFTDSTRDEFGSGGWSTRTCSGVNQRPDFGTNYFILNC